MLQERSFIHPMKGYKLRPSSIGMRITCSHIINYAFHVLQVKLLEYHMHDLLNPSFVFSLLFMVLTPQSLPTLLTLMRVALVAQFKWRLDFDTLYEWTLIRPLLRSFD